LIRPENSAGKFVLPSLVFSIFATYPSSVVTSLLLIEIGLSFGYPVGVMAQMRTLSFGVAFLSALLMGALSVRFKPKTLLMAGLLFLGISALGTGSALNLEMLLLCYAISGLGTSMVEPMVSTLVAEHFPLRKRASVIGWTSAGGGLSYIIGASAVGYIAAVGGWRLAFLGYAMILPFLGLLLSFRGIPSSGQTVSVNDVNLIEGFKAISSRKSAVACLLGNLLASAMGMGIYFYSFSFLRERYMIPKGGASLIFSAASVCFFLGSLVSGRFVDRFGRKTATVAGLLLFSLSTVFCTNLPNMWLGVAFTIMGHLFAAIQYSASNSLSLEQVPGFRGSMMSINSAAAYMGYSLGTGVGGLVLLSFGWNILGIALGAMGIVGVGLYYFFASDPVGI
jgi:MFS family permease